MVMFPKKENDIMKLDLKESHFVEQKRCNC